MKTDDFDYDLPRALHRPGACGRARCVQDARDESRKRASWKTASSACIIEYLEPGDVLVANETRVMPARLLGAKRGTGGQAEAFLLRQRMGTAADAYVATAGPDGALGSNQQAIWEVLVRPGKRFEAGQRCYRRLLRRRGQRGPFRRDCRLGRRLGPRPAHRSRASPLRAPRSTKPCTPWATLRFRPTSSTTRATKSFTKRRTLRHESSAAAPTAGLHFTPELIERLRAKGVEWHTVELEVGLDTFRIVDEDDPEKHTIHTEFYTVPQETVDACDAAHARGNRVIAVGTTSVRSLESAYDRELGRLRARNREATSLYILPGYTFGVVDALVTNFHVPRSTLMMLVSAFSTRENIMAAYKHAIESDYRLLSFGDAMFIR